ncbi:MAG: hypothetical protein R3F61_36995 [Myxococcota bacterium]
MGLRVLLLLAIGCAGSDPEPVPLDTDVSETDVPETDCTAACASSATELEKHVCYSCQCKAAMDGWLPSVDELQCSEGAEIVVSTALEDGTLVPAALDATECANPSLLYGTCSSGGRLGQLTHGTVTVKWICRYNHPVANPDDDTPFDDVGVILHNRRNGASCWFDDDDGTGIAGRNLPPLDLAAGTPDDHEAFERFFYRTNGESCTYCHDNDPFVYTPFLESVGWQTGEYTSAGFSRVTLDGELVSNGTMHLVSPDAAACTACHRITSGNTCDSWVADSTGLQKLPGHQAIVRNAPGTDLWALATWMPPELAVDEAAWEASFGLARDTITRCCASPGSAGCDWEPTPL